MQAIRPDNIAGKEFDSMNSFMLSREGVSQNPLLQSFMDIRTKSPALSLGKEEESAPKQSDSIYAMDGVLTEEQKLKIQFMGGRAGSSIEPYDAQHRQEQKEREKKDEAATRYMQQQSIMLEKLHEQLSGYKSEHQDALTQLATLRREAQEAERRSARSAERLENATETYEEKSQDKADFRQQMGEQVVTINGKEIRMVGGVLRDQDGKAITSEDLAGSNHPMADDMEQYLEDQRAAEAAAREQYAASRSQADAEAAAEAANAEAIAVEERVEDLEQKIEETETQIQDIQESNPELAAASGTEMSHEGAETASISMSATAEPSIELAALETEDPISTAPRTASAVGDMGLVEENRVSAPTKLTSEFKTSAEGASSAPETPDANQDNNLGQTIDVAALQQQQQLLLMQQRQFGAAVA